MKYAVDRIIEKIAILENIDTAEIIEVEIKNLPKEVHEGSILVYDGISYKIDAVTEMKRRENFRERLERLKKLK